MWNAQSSFTLLPKFKYLIAYLNKDQFRVECNRIKLPEGVNKVEPWSRLSVVTELLRKTKMPLEELPAYVQKAKHFKLEKTDPLPETLEGAPDFYSMLYPYQKQAVVWVVEQLNFKTALCDDMGLGKTLQSLCIASIFLYRNRKKRPKLLVLCPAFLLKDWTANIKKRLSEYEEQITLLSYDTAKNRSKALKKEGFTMAILDEAHSLKNSKSQRYKKLAPMLKKIKSFKILLSGTPSTNKAIDYYSFVSILHPSLFRTLKSFTERYWCKISRKSRNAKELAFVIPSLSFIRRSKEDVLNLPPKTITNVLLHDKLAKQSMTKLVETIEKEQDRNMVRYHIGAAFHDLARIKSNSKALREKYQSLLREKRPAKMLIFCQHLDMLEKAEEWARKCGFKAIEVIHGGVTNHKRNIIVHEFQAGRVELLCCTIAAAGVGLTLTQATEVIFLEITWERGLIAQAIDRTHRIGQTSPVTVTKFLLEGSLDEWILRSEQSKKKMQTLLLQAARKLSNK